MKVITIGHFERESKRLIKKYQSLAQEISDLIMGLADNPLQGEPLGKDCYKIRLKIKSKGKGKSGGARVVTCVKVIAETVILVSIYDKSEREDIADGLLLELLQKNGLL